MDRIQKLSNPKCYTLLLRIYNLYFVSDDFDSFKDCSPYSVTLPSFMQREAVAVWTYLFPFHVAREHSRDW
jgi:hypothetical protein